MTDGTGARIGQRLFVALQYALPQHLLSGLMFGFTRLRLGALTRGLIRAFVGHFKVDLREAHWSDPAAYPSFNAFFTRALRADARPPDGAANALLSPVDGTISQIGDIHDGQLFQAKGHEYGVVELLGGDSALARAFDGGRFATLYLSPRDYHRIHMPLDGTLRETIHVPGRLFSVNPVTVAAVPGLFARNERVVCVFDSTVGPLALVLVGAIFVGSIETVWSGRITPQRGRGVRREPAGTRPVRIARGEEMGRFNMGSTVIVLLPADSAQWSPGLGPGSPVRCRTAMGRIASPVAAGRDTHHTDG